MKKTSILLPLLLTACFPVVMPVANPLDQSPNIYGAWRLSDVGGYSPADPNAVFTINSSDDGFSALAECNKVSGRYVAGAENMLSFNEIQADNQCADNAAERRLPEQLRNVRSYRFNSRHLELLNDQGQVVLVGKRLRSERAEGVSTSGETSYLQDARRR